MAGARLTFEERKLILKWYWKYENMAEVQRQWKREFKSEPPTRVTITRIRDKFETDGTVLNVCKQKAGRPKTSTGGQKANMILQKFIETSPKVSVKKFASDNGISRASVYRIIKSVECETADFTKPV